MGSGVHLGDVSIHRQPGRVEPIGERGAIGHVRAWDARGGEADRRWPMGEVAKDAAERVEAVEADVPPDHDVGVRRTGEQRGGAGGARRDEVDERAHPIGSHRIPLGQPVKLTLALLRRRAGAFGEDHGHLVGRHAGGHRAERLELDGGVRRLAIEEVVGQAVADDVETRIGEQLTLEDEAHLHLRDVGDHPGADQ